MDLMAEEMEINTLFFLIISRSEAELSSLDFCSRLVHFLFM